MKHILLVLALFGSAAFAQGQGKQNNLLVDLSFNDGGLHFGLGYEYVYNGAQGVGGQLQYFPKKSAPYAATGYTIVGAMTGFHFYKGDWDFSLTPSLNIINVDVDGTTPGDKTTLGPGIQLGLTTAINDKVALGFVFQNYYIWFGEDAYRGFAISDLSFRVKVGF